jgi:hypothetical protein
MEGYIPMEDQTTTRSNLTDELIRGVFMLLFFVAARLVSVLVAFIALFQFLCALIVRKPNNTARRFGKNLSCYLAEIVLFLSYNTERKPWPFSY